MRKIYFLFLLVILLPSFVSSQWNPEDFYKQSLDPIFYDDWNEIVRHASSWERHDDSKGSNVILNTSGIIGIGELDNNELTSNKSGVKLDLKGFARLREYSNCKNIKTDYDGNLICSTESFLSEFQCNTGEILSFDGYNWVCSSNNAKNEVKTDSITIIGSGASESDALKVPILQNLMGINCNGSMEKLLWNGTQFVCGTDIADVGNGGGTVTSVSVGAGLTSSSNPITTAGMINLNIPNSPCNSQNQKLLWDGTKFICANAPALPNGACADNQRLSWDGNNLTCVDTAVDLDYGAGRGLKIVTQDGNSSLTIDSPACTDGEKLFWDGASFSCRTDLNTGSGGSGNSSFAVNGSIFAWETLSGGSRQLTLRGFDFSSTLNKCIDTPDAYRKLNWDGSEFICSPDLVSENMTDDGVEHSGGNDPFPLNSLDMVDENLAKTQGTIAGQGTKNDPLSVNIQGDDGITSSNKAYATGCALGYDLKWNPFGNNGPGFYCEPIGLVLDENGTSTVGNINNTYVSGTIIGRGTMADPIRMNFDGGAGSPSTCPVGKKIAWENNKFICKDDIVLTRDENILSGSKVASDITGTIIGDGTSTAPIQVNIDTSSLTSMGTKGKCGDGTGGTQHQKLVWDGNKFKCVDEFMAIYTEGGASGGSIRGDGTSGNPLSLGSLFASSSSCEDDQKIIWTGSSFDCVGDHRVMEGQGGNFSKPSGLLLSSSADNITIVSVTAPECDFVTGKLLWKQGQGFICGNDRGVVGGSDSGSGFPSDSSESGVQSVQAGVGLSANGTPGGTILTNGYLSIDAPTCNDSEHKLTWNGVNFECAPDSTGVSKILAGDGISITSSSGNGEGVLTIGLEAGDGGGIGKLAQQDGIFTDPSLIGDGTMANPLRIDDSLFQKRTSPIGGCQNGFVMRNIGQDGTIDCVEDQVGIKTITLGPEFGGGVIDENNPNGVISMNMPAGSCSTDDKKLLWNGTGFVCGFDKGVGADQLIWKNDVDSAVAYFDNRVAIGLNNTDKKFHIKNSNGSELFFSQGSSSAQSNWDNPITFPLDALVISGDTSAGTSVPALILHDKNSTSPVTGIGLKYGPQGSNAGYFWAEMNGIAMGSWKNTYITSQRDYDIWLKSIHGNEIHVHDANGNMTFYKIKNEGTRFHFGYIDESDPNNNSYDLVTIGENIGSLTFADGSRPNMGGLKVSYTAEGGNFAGITVLDRSDVGITGMAFKYGPAEVDSGYIFNVKDQMGILSYGTMAFSAGETHRASNGWHTPNKIVVDNVSLGLPGDMVFYSNNDIDINAVGSTPGKGFIRISGPEQVQIIGNKGVSIKGNTEGTGISVGGTHGAGVGDGIGIVATSDVYIASGWTKQYANVAGDPSPGAWYNANKTGDVDFTSRRYFNFLATEDGTNGNNMKFGEGLVHSELYDGTTFDAPGLQLSGKGMVGIGLQTDSPDAFTGVTLTQGGKVMGMLHSYKDQNTGIALNATWNDAAIAARNNVKFCSGAGANCMGNMIFDTSGNLTINGAYAPASDKRLKKNIQTFDDATEKIMNIRGVSFEYKKNNNKSLGVIAQEIEKDFPELVYEGKDGMKSVNYDGFIAPLIEMNKNQQNLIESQEEKIKILEKRLIELEEKIK